MQTNRSAAIAAGDAYYFTGRPCPLGHVVKRRAQNYNCYKCHCLATNKRHWANRATMLEKQKAYRHRPKISARKVAEAKQWAKDNPEKVLAIKAKYRAAHQQVLKEKSREYHKNNKPAHAERQSRRHRYKGRAMPIWANLIELKAIYGRAAELGLTVDHIVPLKHTLVCGLHVPCNLQLMPRRENLCKSNRFDV